MQKSFHVAVVGATGAVGQTMIKILEERAFPVSRLSLLASRRSQGQRLKFDGREHAVQDLAEFDFAGTDIALFSAGAAVSREFAPRAAAAGCVVVDNTSEFRRDPDIPLIVPEVNPQAIARYKPRNIIANPNCSTIQMVVALKPIYDAVGIRRINVATYQAVSGSGQKGIDELAEQSRQVLASQPVTAGVYPHQIAFNVLPQIDAFQDNGYTKEEMKMVWETQKILEDPDILVNPTAVRVPVMTGHSEAIHIETKRKITAEQARKLLSKAPGVALKTGEDYPTATRVAGTDAVYVGRVREDISSPLGLDLWVVADNLRKGAALNSVQIAELLVAHI